MSALFNDALVTAFSNIGNKNGSAIIKHYSSDQLNNTDPLVLELYVAHKLKALADARYKQAQEAAERAGLITHDGAAGSTVTLYSSNVVTLSRQIKQPSARLDAKRFRTQLILGGVAEQTINKAETEATVYNKPATSFIVALTGT
jgi:hypothetical protein